MAEELRRVRDGRRLGEERRVGSNIPYMGKERRAGDRRNGVSRRSAR